MKTKTTNMMPVSELVEFYYIACEDYHLWDPAEKGNYPVQRMLDALDKFLKNKQK